MQINVNLDSYNDKYYDSIVYFAQASTSYVFDNLSEEINAKILKRIEDLNFKGKFGDVLSVQVNDDSLVKEVIIVGLGSHKDINYLHIIQAAAIASRECNKLRAKKIAISRIDNSIINEELFCKAVTIGVQLGLYDFANFRTKKTSSVFIKQVEILYVSVDHQKSCGDNIKKGNLIAEAIMFARDLANTPSNILIPSYLADIAENIAKCNSLKCKVFDRDEITTIGMGLFSAVARGSSVPPKFIEIEYKYSDDVETIALIGKGITFDTGGYSLKPSASMYGMKDDMSGAAAVLATMKAIASIKPKINILALIPATENCIGENAIHPGDIFKSLAGTYVEVNNTDAEGRLVISDAITYAKNKKVDRIIDLATLTGGCVVALGTDISGIFGNDKKLVKDLINSAFSAGELLWELPLHQDYGRMLKTNVADIKNSSGRKGAAITGALFIQNFVGNTPWVHIDLSSSMVEENTPISRKGCTGAGTGALIEYLFRYSEDLDCR